jgi:2-oxoacid:acceptor oxidoreductase gamma subunit (pyruvate/2-ketoisovalerate family)
MKKEVSETILSTISLPLEIRVHGRGGQGGVTCAKLIAATYAQMDLFVQTFGDYGAERSGAPVRAFTRVDRRVIKNRNKVYRPDHLLVLDEGLLGPNILEGVKDGACILLNSSASPDQLRKQFPQYRFAVIDATGIAREHGIGTSAVVIINTTIVGAYATFMNLPSKALEQTYASFGLTGDLAAAQAASEAVRIFEPTEKSFSADSHEQSTGVTGSVLPITEHHKDIPSSLMTGTWSSQTPLYQEYAAPCSVACPAGNDVVGFIQAVKEQGPEAAARILLKTQPLPSVCGRVCPAPCMTVCNRVFLDGAVNIRSLERWISDKEHPQIIPEQDTNAKKFAVVGSGPAGLSCAYHLARLGQKVSLYEKETKLGGVLRSGIPLYRLPEEILDRDIDRILALGIKSVCNSTLDKKSLMELYHDYDGVIICIGLGQPFSINTAGEKLNGVEQGLNYLAGSKQHEVRLSGTVIVVGGGNTAMDCARSALRSGASSVKLVYRRSREEMPAIIEEIEDGCREGVQLLTQRQPIAFVGDQRVTGIVLAEVELGSPEKDGRRQPIVTDKTVELSCNTVLLALGQKKQLDILPENSDIKENRVWEEETALNIWFAGDCLTGDGTVAHAIGNGRFIALSALAACQGQLKPKEKVYKSTVAPAHIRFSHFPIIPPHEDRHRVMTSFHNNFEEVNLGLSGQEEAERCFSCGHCTHCDTCLVYCPEGIIFRKGQDYVIDKDYCKGCGICVVECPRRAMEMIDK